MKNLDQFIYEQFLLKDNSKFDSYGKYLVACQKKDEFFKKISKEQQKEFNEVLKAYGIYENERNKELVRYVFNFIKSIFY